MIKKAKKLVKLEKSRFFCCQKKKEKEVELRSSMALNPDKKTIILFLEGTFTYNIVTDNARKERKKIIKSINKSAKFKSMKKMYGSSQSCQKLKIPIPLKKGKGTVDVMIRPFSLEFIKELSIRYNIILLTRTKKFVRGFLIFLFLVWELYFECDRPDYQGD
jgi:hypothetical protein